MSSLIIFTKLLFCDDNLCLYFLLRSSVVKRLSRHILVARIYFMAIHNQWACYCDIPRSSWLPCPPAWVHRADNGELNRTNRFSIIAHLLYAGGPLRYVSVSVKVLRGAAPAPRPPTRNWIWTPDSMFFPIGFLVRRAVGTIFYFCPP